MSKCSLSRKWPKVFYVSNKEGKWSSVLCCRRRNALTELSEILLTSYVMWGHHTSLVSALLQVLAWTAACVVTRRCTSPLVCPAPSWCLSCSTTGPIAPSGTQTANSHWSSHLPTAWWRGCWDKQEVFNPNSPSSLTVRISVAFTLGRCHKESLIIKTSLLSRLLPLPPLPRPGVSPLMQLCRLHIRKTVGKQRLGGIHDLHLPTGVKQYLLYQSDPGGDLMHWETRPFNVTIWAFHVQVSRGCTCTTLQWEDYTVAHGCN